LTPLRHGPRSRFRFQLSLLLPPFPTRDINVGRTNMGAISFLPPRIFFFFPLLIPGAVWIRGPKGVYPFSFFFFSGRSSSADYEKGGCCKRQGDPPPFSISFLGNWFSIRYSATGPSFSIRQRTSELEGGHVEPATVFDPSLSFFSVSGIMERIRLLFPFSFSLRGAAVESGNFGWQSASVAPFSFLFRPESTETTPSLPFSFLFSRPFGGGFRHTRRAASFT